MEAKSRQLKALELLRRGVTFILIGWVFMVVAFMVVLFGLPLFIGYTLINYIIRYVAPILSPVTLATQYHLFVGYVMSLATAIIILIIIGIAMALVGLLGPFLNGIDGLSEVHPELSTSGSLIKAGLPFGLILLAFSVVLWLISLVQGFDGLTFNIVVASAILGYILMFVGYIGLVVLCFKMYDMEKSGIYLAAGIIFVL
ncbi:MAG: hypothetical protein ACP5KA_07510, partial [Desulfurococcaceae archaeon]